MTIEGKTVLVTGANRGIGQALAAEALVRGAKRVYAGSRQPLAHPDARVTPLMLDVTSTEQVQAAATGLVASARNRAEANLPGRVDRLPSRYPRNRLVEEGVGKPTTMRVILSWHSLSRRAIPFCGRGGLYG
jgi:nucleoside-diphosphate-sugar epimerase